MTRPDCVLRTIIFMGIATAPLAVTACGPMPPPSASNPRSYVPLCAGALTKVKFDAHMLEGATLTPNDPGIVQVGPPVRVMCGAMSGTHVAVITFDAVCDDFSTAACVDIVSVTVDGEPLLGHVS